MKLIDNGWSELADQARAIADGMKDALARKTMVEIAAGYDRLAKRASVVRMETELEDERPD